MGVSMPSKLKDKIKTFIDHFRKPTYYSHSALLVRCAVLKAILDGKFSVYKHNDIIHVGLGYANIKFYNDKWEVPYTVVQNASKLLPGMISIAHKKMQNTDKIYIPSSKGVVQASLKDLSLRVDVFRMLKLYHTDESYAEYALKRFKDYADRIEAKGIIK